MSASWITLAQAKDFLRRDAAASADDTTLQRFVDGACEAVENAKGHVAPTPLLEDHQCGDGGTVILDERPVLSVQSVTLVHGPGSSEVLDAFVPGVNARGWLSPSPGVVVVPAVAGTWVEVAYTAGVDLIPARWEQAALELVRHANKLWTSNAARRAGAAPEPEYIPGAASAMPNRVRELLDLWGKNQTDEVLFA